MKDRKKRKEKNNIHLKDKSKKKLACAHTIESSEHERNFFFGNSYNNFF